MADDNQVLDPENKRKKYNTYADVEELLKGKVESEEERRARERREKSRQVINSIADVSRALGNMYNTSQYVPNAYDASKDSVSEAYQAKLDKAKAERDKNRDWWLNYALRMANIKASDRASEQAQRNWDAQMEAQQAADKQKQENWEREQLRKEGEVELKARMQEWRMDIEQKKFDLNEAKYQLDKMYKMGKLSLDQKELAEKQLEYTYKLQPYTEVTTIERDHDGKEIKRTKERKVDNQSGRVKKGKSVTLLK